MPDTTPPQGPPQGPPAAEPPPPEDGWRTDLDALRARLDDLDDTIHDLLMQRALVIESVARSGKPAAFRPGREASILRRLLRRHKGNLPARTLVRMWRELLAGTTAMQTAVTIAVADPANKSVMMAMAREHFGFLTAMTECPSPDAALNAVRAGAATLAVLPFPAETDPWWQALNSAEPRLYIIARLPFWASRPPHVPTADALVVGVAAPDSSGSDRSFISAPNRSRLSDAGLTVHAVHGAIVEVNDMVFDGDPRLPADAIALGGYAIPVAGEHA
jgi:chorismate mutase/prephenate dehydratase